MGFRITMGMKMNTYRYNLMLSTNQVANAQEKVETHRKFNSYAEDPANATNAWRVRQNYMDNISYRTETKDTTTRYQTAWLTMGTVKTHLEQYNGKTSAIRAANDPTAEAKKELGNVLSNTAETVIQAINSSKYGDEFVYGGTDGTSPPFSWKGDRLFYRGIDLTPPSMTGGSDRWNDAWGDLDPETGIPKDMPVTGKDEWVLNADGTYTHTYYEQAKDQNGELLFNDDGTPQWDETNRITDPNPVSKDDRDWAIYFKNVETLNKMSKEVQYADLGMGQDEDSAGTIVNGTYFNNAIPGINVLGYGVDNDGDPKNLALLMKKFDHVLSQVDENGTVPAELGGNQRVIDLLGKFDKVCDFTLKGYTNITTEAKFLTSNTETLESQTLNLNEQIVDLEQVDLADAITQFMWDYNCYNAALKIGTQLLSQSLLDYMA